MKVDFDGDRLLTELKVASTTVTWSKDYPTALIDTGAWKTAIPLDDIVSKSTGANLRYTGSHLTHGLGFQGLLDIFEANLSVGGDSFPKSAILATPTFTGPDGNPKQMPAVVGREILACYKWEIDWKAKSVRTTRHEEGMPQVQGGGAITQESPEAPGGARPS